MSSFTSISLLHFAILWLISSRVSTWMSTRTMAIGWSLLSLSFRKVTLRIPFRMLVTLMVHWALRFPGPLKSSACEEFSGWENCAHLIKVELEESKVLVPSNMPLHTISPEEAAVKGIHKVLVHPHITIQEYLCKRNCASQTT